MRFLLFFAQPEGLQGHVGEILGWAVGHPCLHVSASCAATQTGSMRQGRPCSSRNDDWLDLISSEEKPSGLKMMHPTMAVGEGVLSGRGWRAQVLHDFYVARSDFRGAAAAQLALARRLRDEAPAAVDAVRASLSAPPLLSFQSPSTTSSLPLHPQKRGATAVAQPFGVAAPFLFLRDSLALNSCQLSMCGL